jgi:Thiol-disulfide isomerase and thioredoxins
LIALLAFGFTTDPKNVPSPLVGRPAPDFELTALKGEETIHLSELRGTPVLLNFWASWCQECKVEARILEEFHKKIWFGGRTNSSNRYCHSGYSEKRTSFCTPFW